jgi:hypothetical protein
MTRNIFKMLDFSQERQKSNNLKKKTENETLWRKYTGADTSS